MTLDGIIEFGAFCASLPSLFACLPVCLFVGPSVNTNPTVFCVIQVTVFIPIYIFFGSFTASDDHLVALTLT